jgi:very-short-patch-repair endonuclease
VQARLGGLSEDQWQWRLDTGRWQSVLHGVAVAHSGEVTDRQRAWAAVLYVGRDARLSADAALIELGMRLSAPREIHVVSPREVVPQVFAREPDDDVVRVTPHRALRLEEWAHPVRQPPLLRAPVAALHAAAWASSDRAAEWRVAAAVQQRLVRVGDLRPVLQQMPRVHRRGLLREVLDDIEYGAHAASELDFLRFLRAHRLPRPDRLQRPVRTGKLRYLDAWWERQRVNVEMDGTHHRTVGIWDEDALRANDVVLVERHDRILLLRFTRANLRHDAERVAAQLAQALV